MGAGVANGEFDFEPVFFPDAFALGLGLVTDAEVEAEAEAEGVRCAGAETDVDMLVWRWGWGASGADVEGVPALDLEDLDWVDCLAFGFGAACDITSVPYIPSVPKKK